jgi:thiamine biosynthesis lipoprotein
MVSLVKATFPIACILASLSLSGCTPSSLQRFAETRYVMNAPFSIIIYADATPPWDEIFQRADETSVLYDHRVPQSPLAELNRTGQTRLPEPVLSTLKQALALARESDGAYDPTVLPLMTVWDFEHGGRLPEPGEIEDALSKTGYRNVWITDPDTVTLAHGATIDIGGIGEGAVVDATADHLDSLGYAAYLVDAAGEIVMRGAKPDGRPWTVAVRSPRKPGLERTDPAFKETYAGRLGMLEFSPARGRAAVSTSGDYEKFFVAGGKAYAHILDPRTGYPPEGVASVTVIAASCARADSLATTAFVLGYERGAAFLEKQPGAEGLLVRDADGKLESKATSGFPPLIPDDSAE